VFLKKKKTKKKNDRETPAKKKKPPPPQAPRHHQPYAYRITFPGDTNSPRPGEKDRLADWPTGNSPTPYPKNKKKTDSPLLFGAEMNPAPYT